MLVSLTSIALGLPARMKPEIERLSKAEWWDAIAEEERVMIIKGF